MPIDQAPPPTIPNRDEDLLLTLEHATAAIARRHLRACAEAGIHLKVVSGYRSWEEQDRLYRQGRSAPGQVVTWVHGGRSWHNYKRAYDVCPIKDGKLQWDAPEKTWQTIGLIGEHLGLFWGGRWKCRDMGHFHLTGGNTLQGLRKAHEQEVAHRAKLLAHQNATDEDGEDDDETP